MKEILQMFKFLFVTLPNKRMDANDIIYMLTLSNEENETTPVLKFLGMRICFYEFIFVHTDMCAAFLLFHLLSICLVFQK